ncbi:hypothetical protein [Pelagibius sp.]|uniref:hypothetical protein n=1 Tax=Pelagibius sp. TaxID=1931238 RepID=UPI003B5089C4
MLISFEARDREVIETQRSDLQGLLAQSSVSSRKPCGNCGSASATGSACGCGLDWSRLARQLSSDPERFPIEAGILPLVFALSEVPALSPCWSCEGHLDAEGRLHRLPSVWFTCHALAYPSLLAEALAALSAKRVLKHTWQVAAVHCGSQFEPVFAIEPRIDAGDVSLSGLHADILALAANLRDRMHSLAAAHIARLDARLLAA